MKKSACLIVGLIVILMLSVSAEARMLHAAAGKFIDPMGEIPDPYLVQPTTQTNQTNLYNFVGNNPVNYVDPYGLFGFSTGLEGTAAAVGFGGTIGLYGNFAHDDNQSWYRGWSSSATFVAGGGAAGSVYALTGGAHFSANNACNVKQLNGAFGNVGRMGLGAVSIEGYRSPDGSVTGGGFSVGPSLPGSRVYGYGGGSYTWTLGGGNWW